MGGPELDDYKPVKDKEPHKPIRSIIFKENLNLGFCPINTTTVRQIDLYNPNPYQVDFSFQSENITISPSTGIIPQKSKAQITIQYTPSEAIAITEKCVAEFSEEEKPREFHVEAIGKYPYLMVDNQTVQFEKQLVGDCVSNFITIKNCSQVPARFQIFQIKDDEFKDYSFSLDRYQGEIPAQEMTRIQVTYEPHVVNMTSVAHYKIQCPGGNDLVFECVGSSLGYDVYLNTNSINFGEIKIGDETSRLLTIHNESEQPVVFEFFNDKSNIFGFSRTKGRIKPKSYERIIINFNPAHTICYYERVFCIIRNHRLLYVDLIGTCYDLLIKPLPLLQKHIDAFRKRVVAGKITEIDFRYMENAALMKLSHTMTNQYNISQQMAENQKALENSQIGVSQLNKTVLSRKEFENSPSKIHNQSTSQQQNLQQNQSKLAVSSYIPAPAPNQIVLHKELFQTPNSENKMIQLSEEFLDFNFCDFGGSTVSKEITVQNNMACKMTVFWTMCKHEGMNPSNQSVVFKVIPETATLKPKSSFLFTIQFQPSKSQFYFYQRLQFFGFKYSAKLTKKILEDAQKAQTKTLNPSVVNALKGTMGNTSKLRSEDITADETIPPYSGYIGCVGHSFGSGSQPYIPILECYPSNKINFAACSREESKYQTVEIHNTSDTPTYFKFSPDVEQIFRVFPNSGLIKGKSFCVIIFEFSPKEFKAYNKTLACHLNHNLSNVMNFHVHGYASEPKLALQNEGKIYFPPSYTGVYSRQEVKIQNLSRIELSYQIDIPDKYREELYLDPSDGFIKPNETIFLDCQFVPYKKKDYKIKVPMLIKEVLDPEQNLIGYHLPGSGNSDKPLEQRTAKEVNYNFEIFGAGGDGSLSISPQKMKFGIVKVNFNQKKYATLHNYSNCTFYIELKLKRNTQAKPNMNDSQPNPIDDLNEEEMEEYLKQNFTLDFQKGIIAANSKIDVGIMFNPQEVGVHDIILEVIAKEKNPMAGLTQTKWGDKLLCQKCSLRIQAEGSYPLLKICDVRNVEVSVATLWENFQINKINEELGSQLNDDEKLFLNIEQLNFTEASALQKRLKSYDWNFGYLPIKAQVKPRKIVITIQNVGGTECDWQFKLPSDNQIEVEPWADPGEPTDEDAFEKAIIERNIFQIHPKSGTLKPDELKDIVLTYSPGSGDESLLFNKKQNNVQNEKHFLKVILQIINGKPLCLNLKGMTLAPNQGQLAVKKNHYVLPDTPIGLLIPVKVPIEIQNVGSAKVTYRVEITEMDKDGNVIRSKFNIFTVENSQGSLQQGEKQYLYTEFRPLETKTYYHKIKIMVHDYIKLIQEEYITVEGKGYGKNPPKALKKSKEDIPSQRSHVSQQGSKVFFSIEEIDFGKLYPEEQTNRIIILYNLSETKFLDFDFNGPKMNYAIDRQLTCGDDFKIEPQTGSLAPGTFCELKLTLTASKIPSVYEGEIECIILWREDTKTQEENLQKASQVSQASTAMANEKETLFLRIKKNSNLNVELINSYAEKDKNEIKIRELDHMFEIIMENVIYDVINDSKTTKILEKIDNQPVQLFSQFDKEEPANIDKISKGYDDERQIELVNFKDYRQLFLEDEFTDILNLIMENTYFNIIQETTRGECDLSRISKTFVMPSNR